MFKELTRDLLELSVDVKGETGALYAMVVDCCSCSCCGCVFWCG